VSVPEYLYARLINAGMTKEGASAVLGNVQHESAFKPENVEDRSGIPDSDYVRRVNTGQMTRDQYMYDTYGMGLAQWTYPPRKGWMWDWFKSRNKSIDDLEEQVNFLIWEMKEHYSGCWNLCCSSNSLYDCVHKLLWEWENPADKNGQFPLRLSSAQDWFNKLSGLNVGEVEIPGETTSTPVIQHPSKPADEVDDDGIPIDKTFPPRMIDSHCTGFKEIKLLEVLLWCHGYNVLVDGIWSDLLDKNLRKFQREHGLVVDAVCGDNTWRALGLNV